MQGHRGSPVWGSYAVHVFQHQSLALAAGPGYLLLRSWGSGWVSAPLPPHRPCLRLQPSWSLKGVGL